LRCAIAGLLAALIPLVAHAEIDQPASGATERSTTAGSSIQSKGVALSTAAKRNKRICAVAFLLGPASSTNTTLAIGNLLTAQIAFATIDPFRALGGKGLVIDGVDGTVGPKDGATTVLYDADGGGRGPLVLSFTSFNQDDLAIIAMDPDTYGDPNYLATVKQLNRTRIEIAYANGVRCAGELMFDAGENASIANLVQTSP
jgi:hypothetical protein